MADRRDLATRKDRMSERVLLVEDRQSLRAMLSTALAKRFIVDEAADLPNARALLEADRYAVVITDVRLPSGDGTTLLAVSRAQNPAPEVVIMTAYAEVPAAVAALKAGAYDYLAKPFAPDDLLRAVERAADRYRLVQRARLLEDELSASESPLIGTSPQLIEVRRLIEKVGRLPDQLQVGAPASRPGTYRDALERAKEAAGHAYVDALLRRHQGNITAAAIEAGVERETLHRLVRRHGLDAATYRGRDEATSR